MLKSDAVCLLMRVVSPSGKGGMGRPRAFASAVVACTRAFSTVHCSGGARLSPRDAYL